MAEVVKVLEGELKEIIAPEFYEETISVSQNTVRIRVYRIDWDKLVRVRKAIEKYAKIKSFKLRSHAFRDTDWEEEYVPGTCICSALIEIEVEVE